MSDAETRYWMKVDQSGGPLACWQWLGALWNGYGRFTTDGRVRGAHRYAYELVNGPVSAELDMDHLCRNRACVNPAHLEPVTKGENVLRGFGLSAIHARKTHCIHGHEFTPENTYRRQGVRHCRTCNRRRDAAYRQRKAS